MNTLRIKKHEKRGILYNCATWRDYVFRIIVGIIMGLFAVSFIYMLFWMLTNSFRTGGSFNENPFKILDFSNATFENFSTAFTKKVGRSKTTVVIAVGNSLLQMVPPLIIGCFLPSMTGFVGAKYRFIGREFITMLVIISMTIPSISATTSTYKFINAIGLYDSFFGIYLMNAAGLGFGFLLYRNFFAAIPWEYAEAAYIDGAGNWTIYLRIFLPQALPLIVSTAIMGVIGYWNDYSTPYLYLPSHPTIAVFVDTIYTVFVKQGADYPKIFAVMTFSTAVTLIIYAAFSKTIMSSMSAGGIKG